MGRLRAPHSVRRTTLTGALLLISAGVLGSQQPGPPVFSTDVRLVTLPVTVKDARNAPIGDLDRGDFTILEDGEPRDVAVFERRTNRPLSVALMVDASLSTAIELRFERQSAGRFLSRLLGPDANASDAAAVYSFSADTEALSGFTRDHSKLEKALDRVRPQTGTSVYDAVVLVAKDLSRWDGRRVIVMITDGGDTTSRYQFADALRAAHDAEVAIYPLIVLPIRSDAGRNRGGEHALVTLSKNSGGEAFVQHGARDLDVAFAEILRNLRTQYLLGFYPQGEVGDRTERFRGIEVQVHREGAVVLARSGYFADPPPPEARSRRSKDVPVQVRRLPQPSTQPEAGSSESARPEKDSRRPPDGQPRPPIVRPQP